MKILKELDDAKLVIVDLEVRLGDEVRSAPTLCAKYGGDRACCSLAIVQKENVAQRYNNRK